MKTPFYAFISILAAIFQCSAGDMTRYVWGPVSNSVKMSIMVKDLSYRFAPEDITDCFKLTERLRKQSDPVSSFLWNRCSREDQLVLMGYPQMAGNSKQAEGIIVDVLNKIIGETNFYTSDRFKGIVLRPETGVWRTYAGYSGSSGAQVYLDRLLLEDAYPVELSRNPKAGDPTIKIGDEVTLTIIITNMSSNESFLVHTAGLIQNDTLFSFVVVSPSGKQIPAHGDPLHARNGRMYLLEPAKLSQCTLTFPLSAICKFDEVGTYTVTAYRVVYWPEGKKEYVTVTDDDGTSRQIGLEPTFTVVSNPLSIKIVSDK
jgi:hypothetical protein